MPLNSGHRRQRIRRLHPTPLVRYNEGLLYSVNYEGPCFSGTRWFIATLFTGRLCAVGFRQSLEGETKIEFDNKVLRTISGLEEIKCVEWKPCIGLMRRLAVCAFNQIYY